MTYRWRRFASGWRVLLNTVHWKPNIAILGYSLVLTVMDNAHKIRGLRYILFEADRSGLQRLMVHSPPVS